MQAVYGIFFIFLFSSLFLIALKHKVWGLQCGRGKYYVEVLVGSSFSFFVSVVQPSGGHTLHLSPVSPLFSASLLLKGKTVLRSAEEGCWNHKHFFTWIGEFHLVQFISVSAIRSNRDGKRESFQSSSQSTLHSSQKE